MMKFKKTIMPAIIFIMILTHVTGCGQTEPKTEVLKLFSEKIPPLSLAAHIPSKELVEKAKEENLSASDSSAEGIADNTCTVPEMPASGQSLSDFIPAGWKLLDSVELDYNEDGTTDYVAVLQASPSDIKEQVLYPRILFAIASEGTQYRLDFQDINLIRTSLEGGKADPYLPMDADATSFTTHFNGGSAWTWTENNTYTYRNGIWYLTAAEKISDYASYIYDYSLNDYDSGIGIRKKRNDSTKSMEKYWAGEGLPEFDIVYELPLDAPPTLYQASMRWWLAPERITDRDVNNILYANGITLSEDLIMFPSQDPFITTCDDCDEDGLFYVFEADGKYYLAMYHWESHNLSLLLESQTKIDKIIRYEDKIYYSTNIMENITYRKVRDRKESIVETQDCIGMNLNRINLDGSEKEVIFEYLYPGAEQEIKEYLPPYLSLIVEISGHEIVIEVYNGSEPHPFYRMNLDGSGLQLIGQLPKAAS